MISSVASGLWGAFFGKTETASPLPTPVSNSAGNEHEESLSKKTIKMVALSVQDNLKSIYAEKDRIFTNFILVPGQNTLILTDRSGRILFLDPRYLNAQKQTMKGYRNCEVLYFNAGLVIYLPMRNIV